MTFEQMNYALISGCTVIASDDYGQEFKYDKLISIKISYAHGGVIISGELKNSHGSVTYKADKIRLEVERNGRLVETCNRQVRGAILKLQGRQ